MSGRPLLIDTNLLVLYVVGAVSRDLIARHRRLTAFTAADFDLLQRLIADASQVLVTPNTMTETSNLAGYIDEPARSKVFRLLAVVANATGEHYVPSTQATAHRDFVRLGLTDATLLADAFREATLLTTDLQLVVAAQRAGRAVVNFNHLRDW